MGNSGRVERNRFTGNIDDTSTTRITKKKDGTVSVESVNSTGEISRTVSDSEAVYKVEEDGTRALITRFGGTNLQNSIMPSNLISLSSLRNIAEEYGQDGRTRKFRTCRDGRKLEIEFDSSLGQITSMRTESEDGMQVSDVKMDYKVIDGFLVPSRIEGKVTYTIADVEYSAYVEQDFTEIKLNFEEEE